MGSCPSCGAERASLDSRCGACGAPAQSLELELPPASRAPRAPPRNRPRESSNSDAAIELAYDPRASTEGIVVTASPDASMASSPGSELRIGAMSRPITVGDAQRSPAGDDLAGDARLLAGYGAPPESWIACGPYAWKVLRRRRELRGALAARREEVRRAAAALENGLVEVAERIRGEAERHEQYAPLVESLKRTEDLVQARNKALSVENDVDSLRLSAMDGRIAQLQADLERAASEERSAAGELAAAQAGLDRLEREEAMSKRAETSPGAAASPSATGNRTPRE